MVQHRGALADAVATGRRQRALSEMLCVIAAAGQRVALVCGERLECHVRVEVVGAGQQLSPAGWLEGALAPAAPVVACIAGKGKRWVSGRVGPNH